MANTATVHIPVLYDEVLKALQCEQGGKFLDCTVGGGGHMEGMLQSNDTVEVIGLDRDMRAIRRAEQRLENYKGKFTLYHRPFSEAIQVEQDGPFNGILADFGLSTDQLQESRGLSFREDAPLDMRMNEEDALSASEVVNKYSAGDLTRTLGRGGVRRNLKRYVSTILEHRPFDSAKELGDAISAATPIRDRKEKHPATVVFQAIRMEVNSEHREISILLDSVPRLIAPGGTLACIAFHSLEDQMVTKQMRKWKGTGTPANWPGMDAIGTEPLGKLLTRHAIVPSEEEIKQNPSSRSARLRVFRFH